MRTELLDVIALQTQGAAYRLARMHVTLRAGEACAALARPLLLQVRHDHRFDMVSVVPSSLVSETLNFSL